MAVRFVALLIPLAITLPQLQMSRPRAPAPQPPAALVQPAIEAEPMVEPMRLAADTEITRVTAEAPLHEARHTVDGAVIDAPHAAVLTPPVRKATARRATPKVARAATPQKLATSAKAGSDRANSRSGARMTKVMLADVGCLPNAHCAPVVAARVTPVIRHPL